MQRPIAAADRRPNGFLELTKTVVYAILIALVVRTFAFEPFNIPSGSMKPTLLVGDYLFVSKYAYGFSRYSFPFGLAPFGGRVLGGVPKRGDVVVFKLPSDNKTDYIKRVVGLPGDRIQVQQGTLHVNGEVAQLEPDGVFKEDIEGRTLDAPMLRETLPGGVQHEILDLMAVGPLDNTRVYEVPPGHVFCMGDNRDNSLDSRVDTVGFIPIENLIGRAEIIFFSIDGEASWWRPWDWPFEIRYGRFLDRIR